MFTPMAHFNQNDFNTFILDNNIIGFFNEPITFKSGRKGTVYVNWRIAAEDVFLIDRLSDFVLSFVKDLRENGALKIAPETFYGVPEGATKLGVLTQYKWAKMSQNFSKGSHVLAMGRAKAKDHGAARDRFFVGMPKGPIVVIEDVTTTGLSLLETIDKLVEAEVPIAAAMGLTNRMEKRDDGSSVEEAVSSRQSFGRSIPYFAMSDLIQLLPSAVEKYQPSKEMLEGVQRYFDEYGVRAIKL